MAKAKEQTESVAVTLGPASIPVEVLRSLGVEDVNKNGIVLVNERMKVRIMHGDIPVTYTLSLYAQRDAIGEGEQEQVAKQAADRKAATSEREAAEQTKRERETKRAFELGQESTIGALRNIETLTAAARSINKLNS